MDHFSRLGLLAAGRALADADPESFSKNRIGVIVATGFGALETTFAFLDSYIEKGDKLASPIHFSNSVHNAPAAHISICYGLTGPNLTVSQFDLSFICALMTAGIWLEEKRADAVLVGACDAFCDVLGYCIRRFHEKKKYIGNNTFAENAFFFLVSQGEITARHGYIHDIFISRTDQVHRPDPTDGLRVIQGAAVNPCGRDLMPFIRPENEAVRTCQAASPADCGMTLLSAGAPRTPVEYIKLDTDDRCGGFKYDTQ